MTWRIPTRREFLAQSGAFALLSTGKANIALGSDREPKHGFSPIGQLKYPEGFEAFDYVNSSARKGGTLRLARIGQFHTVDTLRYPARPPRDIRLIYDRLWVASDDEIASHYGLLAESIEVSDDLSEIIVTLDSRARWHDGNPVTPDDVVFTFSTLKSNGAPFYRQSFRNLKVESLSGDRIRILDSRGGDRDIFRKLAAIPIHPARLWKDDQTPDQAGLIGSGPYRLANFNPPRNYVLERVDDYWADSLGVNKGRWNFNTLQFEYFLDQTAMFEAFKADLYDIHTETSASRWAGGYEGLSKPTANLKRLDENSPQDASLHGLVVNLRNPAFSDRRVRLALALAYDFDLANKILFNGTFQPFASVFADRPLEANGKTTKGEMDLLAAANLKLDPSAMQNPDPLADFPPAGSRQALAEAARLLDEAGFVFESGGRINPHTGEQWRIRVVATSPQYDRLLGFLQSEWDKLGLVLDRQSPDPASASRQLLDRDFDLATLSWSPARLPGNAERLLWHSELAEMEDSYALSGIADPALDHAIDVMARARSVDALTDAGKLFDRVFRFNMPMLPLYQNSRIRMAWWDRYGRPDASREDLTPSPVDRWWSL
ncbi:MAG: extracellular solute-binding protein [Pseudomonadota bacterium]